MKLLKTISVITLFACLGACQAESTNRVQSASDTFLPIIEETVAERDVKIGSPVFIRIVKSKDAKTINDGYLELFLQNSSDSFELYKSWPICTYSGALGPKLAEGDGQSPEGFYFVTPSAMNPNSSYHLSFNLGFPNAYDRAHGRTGSFLMVHGNCVSIGCYAMTDPVIEEIYTIMTAAYDKGQDFIRVHAFPFRMTDESLATHMDDPNIKFWRNLKQGWDWFEANGVPPNVSVSDRQYQFRAD